MICQIYVKSKIGVMFTYPVLDHNRSERSPSLLIYLKGSDVTKSYTTTRGSRSEKGIFFTGMYVGVFYHVC